jgi:phosphatidylserine/phosphatidylglycerophosphate/cardiolipin synthase-like enzyme
VIRKNLLDLFALDEKTITTQQKYKNEYKSLAKTFSPYLVVCPLDCRAKIENLLSGAQSSIWVSTQYITDEAIINILRNKATTIDLRILTNDMESNRDLVRYFGKDVVRFENPKSYNHDKMIIIDKKKLLIGSTNLSTNALDHNREISIITTDT